MLPDDLDARIRLEARHRGVSIADIAREAIEQHLAAQASTGRLSLFAIGGGGPVDGSERVDELVGKAIAHRHRPPRDRPVLGRGGVEGAPQ